MTTKIEWADITINPVVGCSKCSPGCDNCYAERFAARLAKNPATAAKYAGVVGDDGKWNGRLSNPDLSMFEGLPKTPKRIFVGSMTDIFHDALGAQWNDVEGRRRSNYAIPRIFDAMEHFGQHTFMLLTKRAENMRQWIEFTLENLVDDVLPNLWLGVTVCNQAEADEKIPILLQTPAAKRFVSVEPMLGPVNFHLEDVIGQVWDTLKGGITAESSGLGIATGYQKTPGLDWVICGGETGPGARPMHPDWVLGLRDQCNAAGVPFFFKGWGEWGPLTDDIKTQRYATGPKQINMDYLNPLGKWMFRVGKRRAGRLLDGREWNEVPS